MLRSIRTVLRRAPATRDTHESRRVAADRLVHSLARRSHAPATSPRAAHRVVTALVLLALAGELLHCQRRADHARETPAAAERATAPTEAARGFLRVGDRMPNVLLLTVDTLRADHAAGTGAFGTRLTPALARLGASGTVFLRTTAPAPKTKPALAALHTGSYLHRHGVASNFAPLRADVPVLGELLQRRGYQTAAIYGNQGLRPTSGFGRGFATYVSFVRNDHVTRDADGVAMALRWLAAAPREPWFLWLHLMSPHGPYNSAPRSDEAAALPDALPDVALRPSASNYGLGPFIPRFQVLAIEPRASAYRRRYRDETAFVDAQVGHVLAALDDLGKSGSTVVIFTADHGEGLGEQDYYFQHGWLPNEPSVHVPMIWRMPGKISVGTVSGTTSLVDVLPTLLAGLGLPSPPVDGRNLGSALTGHDAADASVFVLTAYPNQVTAVRRGAWKLVHTPAPPDPLPNDHWHDFYQPAESWSLHDLERDPAEATDLSREEPERLAELRGELIAWERQNGLPGGSRQLPEVDAESREQLRALGYVD